MKIGREPFVLALLGLVLALPGRATAEFIVRTPLEGALCKVHEVADPFHKARTLTKMAAKYAAVQQRKSALTLLSQARQLAEVVGPPHDRAWILANVGYVYVKAGNVTRGLCLFSRAHRVAEQAGDPRGLSSLFTDMACLCAKAGHYDRALRIAQDVDDFWARAVATGKVCECLIEEGQFARAYQILAELAGEPHRMTVQADLACAYARAGQVERALTLAGGLADPQSVAKTWATIAEIVLEAGRRNQALSIAEAMKGEADPFAAFYKTGALIRISKVFDVEGEDTRAYNILTQARLTAQTIRVDQERGKRLAALACTHHEAGQPLRASWILDEAVRLVSSSHLLPHRVSSLAWIAERCARAGLVDEALGLLERATQMVVAIRHNSHGERDRLRAEIACGYASLERYSQAIRHIECIGSSLVRAQTLVSVAEQAIVHRKWDIAFDTARTIRFRETRHADVPLGIIASLYTRASLYCTSLRIIRWIDCPSQRAICLAELGAQYDRQGEKPARGELDLIRYIAKPITMVFRPGRETMDVTPPPRRAYIIQRPDM